MKRFLFVTHSRFKLMEAEQVLNMKLQHYGLDLPELQAVDVEEVVEHKVKYAYEALKRPVMVEDTGLYVDAWNGLPGALVKWFVQRVGDRGLCEMMAHFKERSARAKSVIASFDGNQIKTFMGITEGRIVLAPAGAYGYGWDTIFIPNGTDLTFAQLDPEVRNHYSMRRHALELMQEYYANLPEEEDLELEQIESNGHLSKLPVFSTISR